MFANLSSGQSVVIQSQVELDPFSQYYAEFLDGTYDCVDRIVLNAYFQLGQTGGGFRHWWRQLNGSDEGLDDTHLMRFAGRFSRRVRAHAAQHGIPIIDCHSGERKHLIAAEYLPDDPDFVGVFAILTWRAPAPVWDVKCSASGKIVDIVRKYAYVKQYAFHLMDPDWGHVVIILSPHPPFGAQVILNGHEYVARQARKAGLVFTKEGNCFTDISDAAALAKIAETLRSSDVIGHLAQVGERWIYSSCLCFALSLEDQERSGFRYSYSVHQVEYSRNLLFQHGSQMEDLLNRVIERVWATLDVKRIKTIFGAKRRPFRHASRGKKEPRFEVVLERPTYHLTVLKIHFGKLPVKIYTKGERVLRIEAITHHAGSLGFRMVRVLDSPTCWGCGAKNPNKLGSPIRPPCKLPETHHAKTLACGCSLPKFPQIVAHLTAVLNHFLEVIHCVHRAFINADTLDRLAEPGYVGRTRLGGIDLNKARLRAVIEAVISLAATPQGFKTSEVAVKVREILGVGPEVYTSRQAAYDLKKLRGKSLIRKVEGSRRYQALPEGLQTMTALVILREKVIKPLLSGAGKPGQDSAPKNQHPIDAQYETLQHQLLHLFDLIGIAV
jgi:hypothetical protein